MKFNKIISTFILAGVISLSSSAFASEVPENDIVKENIKEKFNPIYKFNPNFKSTLIPNLNLYELDFGNQKAYTNENVDYLYLKGQLFVSTPNGIVNLTSSPQEALKNGVSGQPKELEEKAQSEASQMINKTTAHKTYNNDYYDGYQKQILNSNGLNDLRIANGFKYTTNQGGSELPKNTVDYVKKIDLSNALKMVYGNGSRSVIMFADPDCPFCQSFDKKLYMNADSLDTTFYILPWTLDIHPNATKKANFIWGQPDRGNAWKSWMLFANENPIKDNPEKVWEEWIKVSGRVENKDVKAPIEETKKIIEEFGLRYTPTVLFPNGSVSEGDVSINDFQKYLSVYDQSFPEVIEYSEQKDTTKQ